jgi:hypothetical protein
MTWKRYFLLAVGTHNMTDERRRQELAMAMEGHAARVTATIDVFAGTFEEVLKRYKGQVHHPCRQRVGRDGVQRRPPAAGRGRAPIPRAVPRALRPGLPDAGQRGRRPCRPEPRKTFVWGLSNRRVSDYVWDQRPRTYDLCLELAQNKLSALDIAKNRKLPSSGSRLQAMNRGNQGRSDDGDKGEKKSTVRCWICGESDHIMRDCPQKMKEKQLAPIRRGRGGGAAAGRATSAAKGGSAGGRTSTRGKPSRGRGGRGGRRLAAIDAEGEEDHADAEDEYSGNEEGSAL